MGNTCKTCYKVCDPIPDCLDTLSIMTTEPDAELTVIIKDKFGKLYKFTGDSTSTGMIVIDLETDGLPKGLLNPYAGEFDISVEKNGEIVPFTIDGVDYDCLRIHVADMFPKVDSFLLDVYNTEEGGYY